MKARRDELAARLAAVDQAHLLAFYEDLDEAGRRGLLDQIEALDLDQIPIWAEHVHGATPAVSAEAAVPADIVGLADVEVRAACAARGAAALRAGQVAAFTVAGGQGSRLGFEGPKGEFPAGPVSGMSLFAWFADGLRAARATHGAAIPWYIMTSPLNHERTVAFFAEHDCFGLDPDSVSFFPQGVLPTFGMDGKILMTAPGVVATNPDGHGGSLKALARSGALTDMHRRGITQISYFQVDNPAVRVIDPVFIGLHLDPTRSSGEMSTKIVRKTEPNERVGVLAQVDGRTHVFEYSDLSAEQCAARAPGGGLRFDAANMAVHVIGVDFALGLNAGGDFALPLHRAVKQVEHIDHHGAPIRSDAVKLETFVFDALPGCARSAVLEAARADEFAPIKNATGADSPATSVALLSERAARFLEARGVAVPRDAKGDLDCLLELTPSREAALAGATRLDLTLSPGAVTVV